MLNLSASSSQRFTLQSSSLFSLYTLNSISNARILFNPKPDNLSLTKTLPRKLSIKSRQSSNDSSKSFSAQASSETPINRIFVGHSIYKGKAALTVDPQPPVFSQVAVFSLSITEIGTLMSLGANNSFEFFHDPNKGRSDEGKVKKVLKVEPLPDGSGHFFNLSVQNRLINTEESIYIPVTKAEYTILVSAFSFIVPYLLGWHAFGNLINPEDGNGGNNADSRAGADAEWNR